METAASGTPKVPDVEMEVDTDTAPASQGPARQHSPSLEAHGEEEVPQGGNA